MGEIKKKKYKTLSSKIVHTNPFYKVEKNKIVLSNGERGEYFIVKKGDAVCIVPIKNGKIVFVNQYRYVFDDWFLELPMGGAEKNKIKKRALKELHEEVGYKTDNIQQIGQFSSINGLMDEYMHVFVARDLEFIGQKLESSEEGMEVVEIEISKAYVMAENGEIKDGQTLAALMLAKKYIYEE